MNRFLVALVACCALLQPLAAQQVTPFKLGTFELDGRPFVGVVLRESTFPPKDATREEREAFRRDNYAKIYEARRRLDDDLRVLLTPAQFETYLKCYPSAPTAPVLRER